MNDKVPFRMPRVLAWEVTRRCPLKCRHCRAGAADLPYARELTTAECRRALDSLAAPSSQPPPLVIWTGGEPMLRPDLLALVSHAAALGMPFQVNTTVSTLNLDRLDALYDAAVRLGAAKLDLFFLVPVGRGKGIARYALSPEQTDRVLDWAFARAVQGPLAIKTTCCPSAPFRWARWKPLHAPAAPLRPPCGCLGGRGFAFLSHVGDLQTCGFIDTPCGTPRDPARDVRAPLAAAANPLGAAGTCRTAEAAEASVHRRSIDVPCAASRATGRARL